MSESDALLNFVKIFVRRKFFILAAALIGALAGFILTLPRPILYRARATAEVPMVNDQFMSIPGLASQASVYNANESNLRTLMEILKSESLISEVVSKLERETLPSLPPTPSGRLFVLRRFMIEKILRRAPQDPVQAMQQGLRLAASSFGVGIMGGTRIIDLVCESTHPELAASFLNTLVHQYAEQSLNTRMKGIQRTTQWMNAQLLELRNKLEQSEERFQNYVRSHGGGSMPLNPVEQNLLAQTKFQQFEREASILQADRATKQALYESLNSADIESLSTAPEGLSLRTPLTTLRGLQAQLTELTPNLTPKHIKIQRLQAQITDAEAALQKEREVIINRLRRDYEEAVRREKAQAAIYAREAKALGKRTDTIMEYEVLKRQVDNDRQLYFAMLQNVNNAGLISQLPSPTLELIDSAQANLRPDNVRLWILNVSLGFVTGLLFSVMLCVLLDKATGRFQNPGEASSLLRVPELGAIPTHSLNGEARGRWQRLMVRGKNYLEPIDKVELVTWHHKPSFLAESFRGTLASLSACPNGKDAYPRTLVVTSPGPQEGKSTVASNLGIALVETHRRVLLIDADLRAPRLHSIFNVSNTWGLTDLMQEKTPVEQYPTEAFVRPTEIPGLFILPSGPPTRSIGAIFHSNRLLQLLNRARQEFDHVIIDTPPVLVFADARFIGRLADGVVVVIRSGGTNRSRALAACERLRGDGIAVYGVILNDWNNKSDDYYGLSAKYYDLS
jgi:capsular exopolysaccharide synthesis family protein